MNFWRQTTHIMSYFKEENFRGDDRLPKSFMSGFLEVSTRNPGVAAEPV
jgi:NADH dehydrogenase (ubiquinone) 1 alpha subcomplex subunit 6